MRSNRAADRPSRARVAWLAAAWLLAAAVVVAPAPAQTLDPASAQALAATLRMLQEPALRGPALAGSPQAAGIDQQMRTVLTPELQQEFYALAADIFADLAQGSGGDASKLAQALEAGRGDPKAFASLLSSRTVERLRALSGKIADPTR